MIPKALSPLFGNNDCFLRRKRLAGVWRYGNKQRFFAIDKVAGVEGREFEAVAMGDGVSWAGFNAVAAEDAAVIVDVIDLGVALSAADAVLFSVLSGLNVNAVGRARSRAKEAGYALFQAIFIALQLMQAAKTLLKYRALIGELLVGIVLNNGGSKHLTEGNGHALGNAGQIAKDRHKPSIMANRQGDKVLPNRRLPKLILAVSVLLLSAFEFGQSSTDPAPNNQAPEEYLHSLVGQKLIMLQFGDTDRAKVKKSDLHKIKISCDIAVQIKMAQQDKDKIDFAWEQIGTPSIWGKKFAHTCRDNNSHDRGILTITGFAPHETTDSLTTSISKVLQTPEQYLATAGIMFNLPAEPDLQSVPSEPATIERPKPLLTFDPAFSEEARKRKYQGRVVVMFYVGTDGRAHRPSIPRPLGMGLDQQALNILSLCRFQPGNKDGKPVAAQLNMEISFNLY